MNSPYRIRLACPKMGEAEQKRVLSVLASGQLIAGPQVAEFEEQLAVVTGRSCAVAVSSGTSALLCAMVAMGIGPGDVVVVPALTFPAPALAASFLGAVVRLCDVDPCTFNLSLDSLQAVVDDDVRMVVAIDQFGGPCPAPELEAFCHERGISLLFDAACAIGSRLDGRPCGSFGTAAVFSFHPRKIITTGEGGAVLTDDPDIAERVRRFRNFGVSRGQFIDAGINLRPSEIGAAMAIPQLRRLTEMLDHRRRLAAIYHSVPLLFQQFLPLTEPNFQTVVARIPGVSTETKRDAFRRRLADAGIEIGIAGYCLSQLPYLQQRFGWTDASVGHALSLHHAGIALPLHEGMTVEDAQCVVDLVFSGLSDMDML